MTDLPTIDVASGRCAGALPNRLLISSAAVGWSSVLLDHVHGEGKSEPFETAPTPDLTIVVATHGEHLVETFKNGRWRQAIYQSGAAGLTPGGETTRLRWSARPSLSSFRSAHLYLPQALVREAADHLRRAGQAAFDNEALSALVFNDSVVADAVHALIRAMDAGADDFYAQQVALSLATHLISLNSQWRDLDDQRAFDVISDRRLARTVEFMSAHAHENLTIDRLAAEAAMSKFAFARAFRRRTGSTPHTFLIDLRLSTARRLLRSTDLTISEIGNTCGFARPAYFATSFKRRYGMSPRSARAVDGVSGKVRSGSRGGG